MNDSSPVWVVASHPYISPDGLCPLKPSIIQPISICKHCINNITGLYLTVFHENAIFHKNWRAWHWILIKSTFRGVFEKKKMIFGVNKRSSTA